MYYFDMRGRMVLKPVKMLNANNLLIIHINIIPDEKRLHYRVIKAVLVVWIHVQARGG